MNEISIGGSTLELLRYWGFIRRKLWLIALITIVSCTAVGYYSNHFLQPQYEASAELIVNSPQVDPKTKVSNVDVGSITSNIMLIKTYKEIIRTPRIMAKVVAQYPELHATADELIAKVSVSALNETQVMSYPLRTILTSGRLRWPMPFRKYSNRKFADS